MKHCIPAIQFATVALLTAMAGGTSTAALADSEYNYDDPTYSAIRITRVDTDFKNLKSAINLGFTLGVRIPQLSRYITAEIDLSSTLIPGENRGSGGLRKGLLPGGGGGGGGGGEGSGKNTQDSDDLRLNTVGLFAAARSPGKFYGMGRVGYRFIESTITELNDDSTGGAWGAGGGYRYSPSGSVELAYTLYGSDLSYLSLVVNY